MRVCRIIGLSDGLMVPFALTAGLSSIGSSKLVYQGGFAELIAGAISMGIGCVHGHPRQPELIITSVATFPPRVNRTSSDTASPPSPTVSTSLAPPKFNVRSTRCSDHLESDQACLAWSPRTSKPPKGKKQSSRIFHRQPAKSSTPCPPSRQPFDDKKQ